MGDLLKRMEALNKRPLENVPNPHRGDLPAPLSHSPQTQTSCAALDDEVGGTFRTAPAGPGYYYIQKPAVEIEHGADLICRSVVGLTGYPDGEAVERIARVCKTPHVAPQEMVFLDLETTGLGRTPLFLIGTMECEPEGLVFKQYFARNYSEEISVISAFAERLESAQIVVTFNGASFDLPFLESRAGVLGVRLPSIRSHLDLLHEARRLYRGQLPNCRLQTLEYAVCGRCREDDIPGAAIPLVYDEYVRTGDASKIGLVLLHNLYDLLTMADLMRRMW